MQFFRWSVLFVATPFAALFAQSLQLTGATGAPGEWIEIRLYLNSPEDNRPSALQWETTIPYALLALVEENRTGSAASAAGKTLSCSTKEKTETTYTSICLLYGGQERIKNGVVAILRLRIAPGAQPGSFRIRVAAALAVDPDVHRTTIDPTETLVKIIPK
jgi:hypothetical protein